MRLGDFFEVMQTMRLKGATLDKVRKVLVIILHSYQAL